MFGGSQKNVFGESSFGQSKPPGGLFGTGAKGDSIQKQSSGLFGMPPIPDLGQPPSMTSSSALSRPGNDPPVLFGKAVTTTPAGGLFGAAKQTTSSQDTFKTVTFSNPFSNASVSGALTQNVFKLPPTAASSADSQVTPIFGSKTPTVEKPVDTPDLFKNVATSATVPVAVSRPTFGFGNPFVGSTSAPASQPLFGQTTKPDQQSAKTTIFGEPTAKKSALDAPAASNIFGSVKTETVDRVKTPPSLFGEPAAKKTPLEANIFGAKSNVAENRLFSSALRQTGSNLAVIPLFGKSTTSAKLDTSVPPPVVFRGALQSRLGKRPLGGAAIQGPDQKSSTLEAQAKRRISPMPNYFEDAPPLEAVPGADKRRLFPEEEIQQSYSIVCKQVPKQALVSKKILEKHFSLFGKVTKVVVSSAKEMAIVHFENHESAKNAKENGLAITPKLMIGAIFFGKSGRKLSGPQIDIDSAPDVSQPPPHIQQHRQPEQSQRQQDQPQQVSLKPKYDSQQLINVTKLQALSDGDRYNILDARDKLMRLQGSANPGDVLTGRCPDMCPEKERYSRSDKNQLRWYEKLDGKIHHSAVLKEYSRSSADQDVPLPHELRPPHILKLSMDHILCNIIDRVENFQGSMSDWYSQLQGRLTSFTGFAMTNENVGDWFEYVWSMTRAIRKDITQQDLKDPVTVDLVEKCARFHIVCAERLIEEDSSRFDRKLNDENLTKCIQTLKHMYEDLRHHDVQCPNEPEFRLYDVLLKLNDGDTLQSIETLPSWVRNSPEMRFALSIYSSLNTNNYVRFFKLVRQSTLLQGCLLLRYFDQVRSRALGTIVKSYVPFKPAIVFSLSKLCYLLGFEDNPACTFFCSMHGLVADYKTDSILLDRSMFQSMESLPDQKRPVVLVESKRNGIPWSEIINGGPLPENPYLSYKPHNSFDSNGYLKCEALNASDQLTQHIQSRPVLLHQQTHVVPQHVAPVRVMYEKEAEELTSEILGEVVDHECSVLGREIVEEVVEDEAAVLIMQDLVDEETCTMSQQVGADSIRECKNEEIHKRLAEEARLSAIEDVCDDLMTEMTRELALEIAVEEMKNVAKQLRLELLMARANEIVLDLCQEVSNEEMKSICKDVIRELREERERKILELQRRQKHREMRNVFKTWKSFAEKRKRQRDTLNHFPSMPSSLDLHSQVAKLGPTPKGDHHVGASAKTHKEVNLLFKAIELEDQMLTKAIMEKINLTQLIRETCRSELSFSFKLLLCLPTLNPESQHRPFCEMIKKKLTREGDHLPIDDPSILTCFIATAVDIEIVVRVVTSQDVNEEIAMSDKKRRETLMGTNAILFLHLDDDDEDSGALERLNGLIDNLPREPPVPVHFLTTSRGSDSSFLENVFDLQRMRDSRKIDNYEITNCLTNIFDLNSIVAVHKSVKWLISNCPASNQPQDLKFQSITNYVEDFLGKAFFQEVGANLQHRLRHGLPHQEPDVLIDLYNAAIDHLELVCVQEDLSEISWPCPELHGGVLNRTTNVPNYWNDPAYLDTVQASLHSLRLPKINSEIFSQNSKSEHAKIISKYFGSFEKSNVDATSCLSRLGSAMQKYVAPRQLYHVTKNLSAIYLPWTEIVENFIEYKIKSLDTLDQFSSKPRQMQVVYFSQHLDQFEAPKSWQAAVGWKPENDASETQKQIKESWLEESRRINRSESHHQSDLSIQVEDEKMQSDAFEQTLKQAIDGTLPTRSVSFHHQTKETAQATLETFYVPVVSWWSPMLANRATSKSVKQRVTILSYDEESVTSQHAAKRRSLPTDFSRPNKSGVVQELKSQVQSDLDDSMVFESRLQAALLTDQ